MYLREKGAILLNSYAVLFSFGILISATALLFFSGSSALAAEEINCQLQLFQPEQKTPKEKFKRGYCFIKSNRFEEGASILNGLQDDLPALADYITYYEAVGHRWAGNKAYAVSLFNKIISEYPETTLKPRAIKSLAEIYLDIGDYERAESSFRSFYAKDIESEEKAYALYKIGEALEAKKKYREALGEYKTLWTEFSESEYAERAYSRISDISAKEGISFAPSTYDYQKRAEKLFDNRRWASAINNFRKAPQTEEVKTKTAISNYRLGRLHDALRTLSQLSSPESLYWKALIYSKQGLDEKASETYAQIHLLYPNSELAPEGLYQAARLYEINDNYSKAIELYDKLTNKYPKNEFAEDGAWYLGWIYYKRKMYNRALSTFSAFTEASSRFNASNAKYWKARTLEKLGREKEATAVYQDLAKSPIPTYHSYLAQRKTGIAPDYNGSVKAANTYSARLELIEKKADLLLELGIFEDALLEIERMHADANSKEELALVSNLYAKADDFYTSINIAQDLDTPQAYKLSFPRGFKEVVKPFAAKYGVDEYLVYSLIREESRFQKEVVSPANAVGLMQLLPSTARTIAPSAGISGFQADMLTVPRVNVELGIYYLRHVLDRFGGDVELALASYNAGPHRAADWVKRFPGLEKDEFIEEIPFRETRNYIRRILRSYGAYKALYGDGASKSGIN